MKKLKIFLMLSILLCFGFMLRFEVHAQGNGPKVIEIGDVLPAGVMIKISWDFTGYPVASDDTFWIEGTNDFYIDIEEFGSISLNIMGDQFSGDTPGETVITLSSSSTITSFNSDGKDYYEYIHGAIFWVDYEELSYQAGYNAAREYYGWNDGGDWYTADEVWIMSYEHAREEFGYYDPITDRWLSVSEYLELYTGQNGFYNNFDKYFIPAMIIVFGGAIVLTILKVFKGRE